MVATLRVFLAEIICGVLIGSSYTKSASDWPERHEEWQPRTVHSVHSAHVDYSCKLWKKKKDKRLVKLCDWESMDSKALYASQRHEAGGMR